MSLIQTISIQTISMLGSGVLLLAVIRLAIDRPINRRLNNLLDEKTNPSADIRCVCMIRKDVLSEPGVAQVLNGELFVWGLTGDMTRVRLDQVDVTKVRWNRFCLGQYGWWRKTMFYMDIPNVGRLVLGVDEPKPWRGVFRLSTKN